MRRNYNLKPLSLFLNTVEGVGGLRFRGKKKQEAKKRSGGFWHLEGVQHQFMYQKYFDKSNISTLELHLPSYFYTCRNCVVHMPHASPVRVMSLESTYYSVLH